MGKRSLKKPLVVAIWGPLSSGKTQIMHELEKRHPEWCYRGECEIKQHPQGQVDNVHEHTLGQLWRVLNLLNKIITLKAVENSEYDVVIFESWIRDVIAYTRTIKDEKVVYYIEQILRKMEKMLDVYNINPVDIEFFIDTDLETVVERAAKRCKGQAEEQNETNTGYIQQILDNFERIYTEQNYRMVRINNGKGAKLEDTVDKVEKVILERLEMINSNG